MRFRNRPVILLGHGARLAGADCAGLLDIGIPVLTSWLAKDLIDNTHPMYFGSPGVYGQRVANNVLYHADQVIALGNRLSIWNVGHTGLREDQELWMCDVDPLEVLRHRHAVHLRQNLPSFVDALSGERVYREDWWAQCAGWKQSLPLVESPAHDEVDGYVNTYRFMQALEPLLACDEIIVTDAGTFMCPAFQVLRLKPPQRMFTSGGLGEMGCALPMAVGAAKASGRRVICLVGDGGMMLNVQELATIAHHRLPVKIIVFCNDGYTMIKHSQRALGYQASGVSDQTGVSVPSFTALSNAFGIRSMGLVVPAEFAWFMDFMFSDDSPALLAVRCHPLQPAVPKLNPIRNADGTISSPRFCDMEPRL